MDTKLVIPGWAYVLLLAVVGGLGYLLENQAGVPLAQWAWVLVGVALTALKVIAENSAPVVRGVQRRSLWHRLWWG